MYQFRVLPLILALTLVLGACAGQAPEDEGDVLLPSAAPVAMPTAVAAGIYAPTPASEPVVIRFGAQEYKRASYQPLIDQFNNENPDVHVEFLSLDAIVREGDTYNFDTKKIVRVADVVELFGVSESDITAKLVLDLKLFIDTDSSFDRTDFFPAALQEANAALYSVPLALNLPLLRYNRDLWDAAGLPSPKPHWNWTDFSGALDQIAKKRGDEVETYGYVSRNSAMVMLLGDLVANGMEVQSKSTATIDDPKVVEAIQRVLGLEKQGVFFVGSSNDNNSGFDTHAFGTMRTLIVEGHAGVWDSQMGMESEQLPYGVGTMVLPNGSNTQQSYGESLAISAGTQSPQVAWRWLSFLSRQQIIEPSAFDRGPSHIPARKSVAESSGYWKNLDAEATAVVQSIVEQPNTSSADLDFQFYAPLQIALDAVRKGANPAVAIRDAQTEREHQRASTPAAQPTIAPFVVEPPKRVVAAQGAAKIIFTVPYDVGRYEPLAKQFNEKNPDVFVELRTTPPTTATLKIDDVAQNSDCFLYWSPPEKKDYSLLLDLQPLADADASFPRNDYPPATFARLRDGSALYGLPQEINMPMLGYNVMAFEQAGIAPPTAEWTLDNLAEAATRLTQGEGETKHYGYASQGSYDMLTFLGQSGARATTGSGEDIQPNFTDPKVAQSIRTYLDLLKNTSPNGKLGGYSRATNGEDVFSLQIQGRIGMWYQFSLNQGSFGMDEDKTKYQPAVAPLPASASLGASSMSGNSFHISAKTEHQQACWKWIMYLGGQASAVEYGIPARLSVANSAAFLDTAPSGAAEIVKSYSALAAGPATSDPWWQTDMDFFWFFRAVDRALQGEDVDGELADAQRLTTDFLACVRAGETGPACAKQIDSTYDGWQNSGER